MIKIETLCEKMSNTYLISNGKELIIIDPSIECRTIKQIINKYYENQKVAAILLTHGHYDHFTTLKEMIKEFNVPLYISKNDYSKINDLNLSCASLFGIRKIDEFNDETIFLTEGKMQISTFNLKIIFTPGHTNGSVSIIIEDSIFTGDTLFLDGVGRTDLPTGSEKLLHTSLHKLMSLKENYQVYPGHGEKTTINQEKNCNYYYQRIINTIK